eukprot:TRINITY_DN1925_c0_g1_i1.p1 TRINITY_DN1925_c0_g1~~TRINITY_DN1925_c0_g1_i1.p1  ORF type:complete len:560 (+),score=85.55 TRINITY_DN1925_c0_g1_i1:47-1726(+)
MDVAVRFNESSQMVSISADESAWSVKQKIAEQNDLQPEYLCLSFEGDPIDDHKPIFSTGISHDSELVVEFSKRGASLVELQRQGVEPTITNLVLAMRDGRKLIPHLVNTIDDLNKCDERKRYPITEACKTGTPWIIKLLIENNVEVNVVGTNEAQPLFSVASHGNIDLVRLLLDAGADPNKRSGATKMTPLSVACRTKNNLEVIQLLIEKGADLKLTCTKGRTAFMNACQRDVSRAQYLISNHCSEICVNAEGSQGETALSIAVASESTDLVTKILELGAVVTSSLLLAVSRLTTPSIPLLIVDKLKQQQRLAVLNERMSSSGDSPLMLSIKHKASPTFISALLENGADPNYLNDCQQTPLHVLCLNYDSVVAKMLLDHGAVFDAKDNRGRTPLEVSAISLRWAVRQPAMMLLSMTTKKEELSNCLYLNGCCDEEFSSTLLAMGADPNYLPQVLVWSTPAFILQSAKSSLLRQAIECGGDINMSTGDLGITHSHSGVTPLMIAGWNNKPDNVKLLLEHGANTEARDEDGNTAADYATGECAELLGSTRPRKEPRWKYSF